MKVNFNGKDNDSDESVLVGGDYQSMMKMRKKQLPRFKDSIQEVLKDYDGQSIAIIVMKEDENGLPDGSHVIVAGCSRMETQIAMSKALSSTSDKVMEMIIESSKGDVKAMLSIASALVNIMEKEDK